MGNSSSDSRRKYNEYFESSGKIGSGTFAIVKRCTRKCDKKEFAVKIIDKRHLTNRELAGLKDEIKILKGMKFRHIIKMADVFDDGKRVRMVLELCEGGDLFDQILKSPKKRFEEPKAALFTAIIARALKYLHDHFVVHRDLKPENILFTKTGVLKITDFGLAHYLKLQPENHVMHTCCGTPHYVAPEVLNDNDYGPQVDFWSLGVILYIMLSGYQPFNSNSIDSMYRMIMHGHYRFPSPHWDSVSEEAKDCVRSLMCVDFKKRLNSDDLMKHPWIAKHVSMKQFQQKAGEENEEDEEDEEEERESLLDSKTINNFFGTMHTNNYHDKTKKSLFIEDLSHETTNSKNDGDADKHNTEEIRDD